MQNTREEIEHEWLHLILENASDAILILDRQRTIRYANKAAGIMGGYTSSDELLGLSYDDILSQHYIYDETGAISAPASYPSNRALAEGIETRNKVFRQTSKTSGKGYWINVTSIPLFNAQHVVEFAIVFFRDISNKKVRDDRVKFLIESAKVLSLDTDFKTRLEEKAKLIVPLLAYWCTLNIVNDDGTVSRDVVMHRDPTKTPLVERLAILSEDPTSDSGIYGAIKTGISQLFPHISPASMAADGPPSEERSRLLEILQPFSAMIIPIIAEGKVLGVISLAYTTSGSGRSYAPEDVTFMEEFCRHLAIMFDNTRLYKKIEDHTKAQNAFLASLSHELRNPLAPIKSSIELLQLQELAPEFREQVDIIERQFDHMNRLLQDLLDVTRFSRAMVHIEKKTLNLQELIENIVKENRSFLAKKGIAVSVTMPPEPIYIFADKVRIQQAITNVLHNSEKFTPEGGSIWLTAKLDMGNVVIAIRDNGEGMDKDEIRKIFHPTPEQYPYKKTPHHTGLGMGLVLVREIIALHKGSFGAHSDGLGKGSTFTITLPIATEDQYGAEPKGDIRGVSLGGGKKILVVDDNEAAAKGLQKLLDHKGHRTQVAHTGADALSILQDFSPSVVLLDIGLPDMDGYELTRKIRREYAGSPTIVALTGYGQESDKLAAQRAGCNFHLTKPVSIADIETLLGF